jgi:tRNA-specific 2-thiouridylase
LNTTKTRVIVGMSGGVDSSVAAWLLKEQGYDVHGLFMKNWEDDDTASHCTASEDRLDAKKVCAELEIPLHFINFSREYKEQVFSWFLSEYRAGRTPNPDVLCNREIKFNHFLHYAKRLGAQCIATGHYARVEKVEGHFHLLKGLDPQKDQSYFLHLLDQDQLCTTLFPLGELEKSEVRQLAEQAGFENYGKKDSTGICFIGERDFKEFLGRYIAFQPGDMITPEGQVVGKHDGLSFYTIGQRKGLGIGGLKGAADDPWFVVDKCQSSNQLIVAQGHDHPLLMTDALMCPSLHWISGVPPEKGGFRCHAKTRYRQSDQECELFLDAQGRWQVYFSEPQRAVTPGQSVVFYKGDICLGGGIIEQRYNRRADAG